MTVDPPNECPACAFQVRRCRTLLRALVSGLIEFNAFAYNYSLHAVHGYACCTEQCVDAMPDALIPDYFAYLQGHLEPVGFEPCPRVFLSGSPSEAELEAKKQELRPKYMLLFGLVRDRATGRAEPTED